MRIHSHESSIQLSLIAVLTRLALIAVTEIEIGLLTMLGVIYDPIKYARVSFEYQRLDLLQTVNRYRIGFQLNF